MDVGMSQYELVRLENIRKNEEFLKALGLLNGSDGRNKNDGKDMTTTTTTVARQLVRDKEKRKHRQVKIERSRDDVDPPVVRLTRSKRKVTDTALEGTGNLWTDTSTDKENDDIDTLNMRGRHKAKHGDNDDNIDYGNNDGDGEVLTRFSHADLESYMLTVNSKHADQLSDEVLRHTVYRCSYMSVAALKARLNNMTNVDKLIAFCYALRFMGLTHLYEMCSRKLSSKYNVHIDLPTANPESIGTIDEQVS